MGPKNARRSGQCRGKDRHPEGGDGQGPAPVALATKACSFPILETTRPDS
jgi:hypothetical protein